MATTPGTTPTDLEFIGHIIRDKFEEEPWYKKIANTLTAIIGAIATIAGGILSMGLDLPYWAVVTIVTITSLGTALGVRGTKNGFSESLRRKLTDAQAEYIDARHTHDDTVDEPESPEPEYVGQHRLRDTVNDAARDLTDWVDRFNADRRSR
ncbi:hypothetical protein PQI66_09765 [Corynebacterium sp. USCH3]|uniref:hypothetical protein n=1 Tax=Corynebacterium sp. USCH3 TaxID=3024840 RepID=UPI0030AFADC6